MNRIYSLFQQRITYALLISFFLQNCGGNLPIPTPDIQPLVGQQLIARGGHKVIFHGQMGELRADVTLNALQSSSKTYEGINVYVEQDTDLASLPQLDVKAQQRRIQLYPARGGQLAKIVIYKGAGLAGGGYNEEEEEEEDKGNQEDKKSKKNKQEKIKGKKSQLFMHASQNNLEMVKALLELGINPNIHIGKNPLLHLVIIRGGSMPVIKLLIEYGVDIHAKDQFGHTPLHWAAKQGHLEIVHLLLEKGAKVNAKDNSNIGISPLELAARESHTEVVDLLIKHGADINARSILNASLLHKASMDGDLKLTSLLLEMGADIHAKDKFGYTPLHWAAKQGHLDIVRLLLEKGAKINAKDTFGLSPLHWAEKESHKEIVVFLKQEAKRSNNGACITS